MAITHAEYTLLTSLKTSDILPRQPHVLELGKSNWYGDVPLSQLGKDIYRFLEAPQQRKPLLLELDRLATQETPTRLFDIADIFFQVFLNYATLSAIDPGVPHSTFQYDLNQPVPLTKQFDVVLNSGTAEHIFNVFQFFKTAHDLTVPGGLMVHGVPFTGWIDHGFYNFQPTFFWDLASSNGYHVLVLLYAELTPPKIIQLNNREHILQLACQGQFSGNSLLYAALRKGTVQSDFRTPMQGYYAGILSRKQLKHGKVFAAQPSLESA